MTVKTEVIFQDVTLDSGIDYEQNDLAVRPFSNPSALDLQDIEVLYMSGGAAIGDFDQDSYADIYATRINQPDILYHNNGDGTFTDVTIASGILREKGSSGAAWIDVDRDGDLDLYVTSLLDTRSYLFLNDGKGVFKEDAQSRSAYADDGLVKSPFSVGVGDFDKDGFADLFTTNWHKGFSDGKKVSASQLLQNKGAEKPGYFRDVTAESGINGIFPSTRVDLRDLPGTYAFTPQFGDLDKDGYEDLVIAADFGGSRLYWGRAKGDFDLADRSIGIASDENGMGSVLADFDNDGYQDWFVTSVLDPLKTCFSMPCLWGHTGNRLYMNNGNRTFSDQTDNAGVRDGGWGWGAVAFDYDNDGDLDLAMTNGMVMQVNMSFMPADMPNTDKMLAPFLNDSLKLWVNDGKGHFKENALEAGLRNSLSGKALLSFDYDNDGDLDLFLVNNGQKPALYRNDGGNKNHWIRFVPDSDNPILGTKITLKNLSTDSIQYRELDAGVGFAGQSQQMAHFGLGSISKGEFFEVNILWPDGSVEVLNNLEVDNVYVLKKGKVEKTFSSIKTSGSKHEGLTISKAFSDEKENILIQDAGFSIHPVFGFFFAIMILAYILFRKDV